jgi:hypothetical protein
MRLMRRSQSACNLSASSGTPATSNDREFQFELVFEGAGPLGLFFVQDELMEIRISKVGRGSVASHDKRAEAGLILRGVNGRLVDSSTSFQNAMNDIGAVWRTSHKIRLALSPGCAARTLGQHSSRRLGDRRSKSVNSLSNSKLANSLSAIAEVADVLERSPRLVPAAAGYAPNMRPSSPANDKVGSVEDFLESIDANEYHFNICALGVTCAGDLFFVEDQDLVELGMPKFQRRQFRSALEKMVAQPSISKILPHVSTSPGKPDWGKNSGAPSPLNLDDNVAKHAPILLSARSGEQLASPGVVALHDSSDEEDEYEMPVQKVPTMAVPNVKACYISPLLSVDETRDEIAKARELHSTARIWTV